MEHTVGLVTISQPVFHPIFGNDDNSTKIDFGNLKDVATLWDDLSKPNIGAASVALSQRSVAVSAAFAGPTIDSTQTRTLTTDKGKVTGNTTSSTSTVAQKSPDAPAVPVAPAPGGAEDKLLALLAASGIKPTLPPDVKASLVHSYQAYMQNLEAFSNRRDFIEGDWLPYRVQFVLAADPGWYSAKYDYDAVAHVTFGKEDDRIQVVSVMPTETAQVVEDLNASYRSFALALALSGGYGPVAASAEIKNLDALAERLEGQRVNTNLIVSYPKANEVRVRVRPSLTGVRGNQRDLQPTSRLMTAIVRVPRLTKDQKSRVPQATLDRMGKAAATVAPADGDGVVTEVTVELRSEFAPGPQDRRNGVASTPASKVVNQSNGATYMATLPAWKEPVPAPMIKVAELAGALHPSAKDAKQGVVALAYTLSLPASARSSLKVEVAGAAEGLWSSPGSVAPAGVLAVPVVLPPTGATEVSLAVRFTATLPASADGKVPANELNVSTLVAVPVPLDRDGGDDAKNPNVKVSGMALNRLDLKLTPGGSGDKSDVQVVPPSTAPAGGK